MPRTRLYYALKPYLPWTVRNALRRAFGNRIRASTRGIWPIDPRSQRAPAGWQGWPGGKKFSFVITHDVEGHAGLDRCRKLAELEMAFGVRSSFNFVPEGDYATPRELMSWLTENGFEVGVHDLHHDGKLFRTRREFTESVQRINHYLKEWKAVGFRSGFMLRELNWIHELDILYDTSTFDTDPFEPQPDGAGTIFPFWISPPADQPGKRGYMELPYTLPQDSTLFLLLKESTPDIWLRKLDWVAENGGMALVNVHPDYTRFDGDPESPRTFPVGHYVRLIDHVRRRYGDAVWQPLPRELAGYAATSKPPQPPKMGRRICLISYSFYEQDSRVFRYARALAERGDTVEILSLRSSPEQPPEEMVDGCLVVRLQERQRNEKTPMAYLLRLLRFVRLCSRWISRQHRSRHYDLVHVHNVPDFLVFAAWRPKLSGTPIILDIHDIVPELFGSKFGVGSKTFMLRMLKWMERVSASFASHVILANHLWVSTYTARSAPTPKVSVLINYVDGHIFRPRPRTRRDDRLIAIFPGSLQLHQGLDVAITAFPRVVEALPQAELHIYGEGPARPGLEAQAASLGLAAKVKFFGYVSTEEIAGIMSEADLGVVPKRADSFGNEAFSTKIFEFMSLGIPVVASSTKIDRYYFNDSVVRFFESGNSGSLAEAMIELFRDSNLRSRQAERAKEFVSHFRWADKKLEYLDLVDQLCAKPR